jgi:hypothetical protein
MQLTQYQVDLLVGANQLKDLPDYISGLRCYAHDSRKNYDFDCSDFLMIAQKELTILSVLGVVTLVSSIVACGSSKASPDGLDGLSDQGCILSSAKWYGLSAGSLQLGDDRASVAAVRVARRDGMLGCVQ